MIIHDHGTHTVHGHDIIYSEGDWNLCRVGKNAPYWAPHKGPVYVYHRCTPSGNFTATREEYADMAYPCCWCKSTVPGGLQAMFLFFGGLT